MNITESNAVNVILKALPPAQRKDPRIKQAALCLVTKSSKVLGAGLAPRDVERW